MAYNKRATSKESWGEIVSRFKTYLLTSDRSPHTVHHYGDDVEEFGEWWADGAAHARPDRITQEVVIQWVRHLREEVINERTGQRRKPATINAKLAALGAFLRWAVRQKIIKDMPEMPPRAKLGQHEVKSLDAKRQRQLLRKSASDRNRQHHFVVVILLETALRVAELVALRWYDVDLKERKGWFTVRSGKGRKPRGPLPMSPDAFRAFKALREMYPDAAAADQVLRSQRIEKPLTIRGVQQITTKYARQLRWDKLTPHQLRHTWAINQRDKKTPWPTIAGYMGHSSVKTTWDSYGTASDRDYAIAVGADIDSED